MECAICKKEAAEAQLYEGILDRSVVKICPTCVELEDIPIIRKPSQEQLDRADSSQSVRERMERLSSRGRVTDISPDQSIVQRNIARLRAPESKQKHPDVLDNYYWEVNIARRRRKLSIVQVAQMTGIPVETVQNIEKGQIPKNFEQTFIKLEEFFGISLLKAHRKDVLFLKNAPKKTDADIINEVKDRMKNPLNREKVVLEAIHRDRLRDRHEKVEQIKSGNFDFSDRDKARNVTLKDLAKAKRDREQHEKMLQERRAREEKKKPADEEMIGDDVDFELEEL
jgi:ribosome-binding protein aMBF1 (putative translation factor)